MKTKHFLQIINIYELFILPWVFQSGKYTHFPGKIKTTLDKKSH